MLDYKQVVDIIKKIRKHDKSILLIKNLDSSIIYRHMGLEEQAMEHFGKNFKNKFYGAVYRAYKREMIAISENTGE